MRSISAIRHALLDAEDSIRACQIHSRLSKEVRGAQRVVDRILDQPETDYNSVREALKSVSNKLPGDCIICTQVAAQLFDIEDEIRRDSYVFSPVASSAADLPADDFLYSLVTKSYPFPIARPYRQISAVEDTRSVVDKIIDAFDFSYRYSLYVILASILWRTESEEKKTLVRHVWSQLKLPTLGRIGSLINTIGENFEFADPFFRSLVTALKECEREIKQLVNLRNDRKHITGHVSDFLAEEKEYLKKFLWTVRSLSQATLFYLLSPVNFRKDQNGVEYQVAKWMGTDLDPRIDVKCLPTNNLFENFHVCLVLQENEREKIFEQCISLYPLIVAFGTEPVRSIYIYHSYDKQKGQFKFVHPSYEQKTITGGRDKRLFMDLEGKIFHGELE